MAATSPSTRRGNSRRQSIRRGLLLFALLTFPLTINYLSPYIIVVAAAEGVINGSFIAFGLLFVSALFLGRAWCGWLCPGAGLQAVCAPINSSPARGGKRDLIKWAIWIPWVVVIGALAVAAGGYRTVDLFFLTEEVISVSRPEAYVIYFTVVGVFVLLALALGRRAACHYICWMAPFMILGRWLSHLPRLPALHLKARPTECTGCGRCTTSCPMSLDVAGLVRKESMEDPECILCGTCADTCPRRIIAYAFDRQR